MNEDKNVVFNEDCALTQQRLIEYDYCIFSPPDFEEIGYSPVEIVAYQDFLIDRIVNLKPKSGYITIFISDRKYKGGVVGKHQIIRELMESLDYKLVSQKIWVKSYKKNLYRMNYTFILTFKNKEATKANPILADVFYAEHKNVGNYSYNFSIDVVKTFIEAYTSEEQTVYDPFMGVSSTAIACLDTDRNYYGSEIDPEVFEQGQELLRSYDSLWTNCNMINGLDSMDVILTK